MLRRIALAAALAALTACPRREPPPAPPRDPNVQLHVENAPGVPTVDIRRVADGGATRIQIGNVNTRLPSRENEPLPTGE